MRYSNACIPLGYAWSSPFARWQGPLADLSSLDLAVAVTGRALAERGLPATEVSQLVLGWTIPQPEIFYGAPTVAARLGAEGVTGPMIGQACATSPRPRSMPGRRSRWSSRPTGPATDRTWSIRRRPHPGAGRALRTG